MTKRRQRKVLTVRVEFEPNRLSRDCLQKAYQMFSPTVAVSLAKTLTTDERESDQQTESDVMLPARRPQ
jgi:hypothetical protein